VLAADYANLSITLRRIAAGRSFWILLDLDAVIHAHVLDSRMPCTTLSAYRASPGHEASAEIAPPRLANASVAY